MSEMPCPQCRKPLGRQNTTWGLAFRCHECSGWLMAEQVLRAAANPDAVQRLWLAAKQCTFNRGRMCPVCGMSMRMVPGAVSGAPCDLDVCVRCQVAWLDAGELEQFPNTADSAAATSAGLATPSFAQRQSPWQREMSAAGGAPSGYNPLGGWRFMGAMLGMPVEMDQPTAGPPPLVTWITIGITSLLSLLAFGGLAQVIEAWAFYPNDPWRHSGLTLLTPFFIHGGIMHLVGNMLFFFAFGDNVEHRIGGVRLLWLLALATVAGNLGQMALDPTSAIPLVGASGGISGVLVYYALAFPKARLGMFMFFRLMEVNVMMYLLFWVGMQFLTAAQQHAGGGGVAWMAHLGGAAAGLLFFFFTRPQPQA